MRRTVTLSRKVGWFSKASPERSQPVRPFSKLQLSGALKESGLGGATSHAGPDFTTMANDFAEVLPNLSFAVAATVFVPSGKNEPDGGRQTIWGDTSTLSVAVTLKLTARPAWPVCCDQPPHTTLIVAGTLIDGGNSSRTTTLNWQRCIWMSST